MDRRLRRRRGGGFEAAVGLGLAEGFFEVGDGNSAGAFSGAEGGAEGGGAGDFEAGHGSVENVGDELGDAVVFGSSAGEVDAFLVPVRATGSGGAC